jgi:transcriptional antiterminator NusG
MDDENHWAREEAKSHSESTEDSVRGSMRWYAIQVISNGEGRVRNNLLEYSSKNGMSQHIGRILFPTETINEIRNGRKNTRVKKLYPGYLFLELRLRDDEGKLNLGVWQYVRDVTGVMRFVGGNDPLPLKQSEVDSIMRQVEVDGTSDKFRSEFSVGMLVKVTDGPFAGSEGEVEALDEEVGLARVLVSLFGRSTPVDLEFWQIIKKEM